MTKMSDEEFQWRLDMLSKTETYDGCAGSAQQEPKTACGAMVAGENRERRERPRMSDIERSVDKHFGGVNIMGTDKPCTYGSETSPSQEFDKNTPESLKTLRWAIYEVIDNYQGDYGKTIAGCLKQEVERLFQEYTHS